MTFKKNLQQKITIDRIGRQVKSSIGPSGGEKRLDRRVMRQLLQLSPFRYQKIRDLDLWLLQTGSEPQKVLVLDNDLAVYETTVEDVAIRKSPTIKEMINIRNAMKILNDSDVVKTKKETSLFMVWKSCIRQIDLSYTPKDLDDLAAEGAAALHTGDPEAVVETLLLFAELLNFSPAPKGFAIAGFTIVGRISSGKAGETVFGPLVLYDPKSNRLKWMDLPVSSLDKARATLIQQVAADAADPDMEGPDVFSKLRDMAGQAIFDPFSRIG